MPILNSKMLLLAAFVLLSPAAESAEIYKCEGENGKVIYQNTPCRNAESVEKMNIDSEPTDPEAVEARGKAREEKLRQYSERAEEAHEKRKAAAAERKKKNAECEAARKRLVELNSARRVKSEAEGGYLTAEQITQRRTEAQEAVRKACGN